MEWESKQVKPEQVEFKNLLALSSKHVFRATFRVTWSFVYLQQFLCLLIRLPILFADLAHRDLGDGLGKSELSLFPQFKNSKLLSSPK